MGHIKDDFMISWTGDTKTMEYEILPQKLDSFQRSGADVPLWCSVSACGDRRFIGYLTVCLTEFPVS